MRVNITAKTRQPAEFPFNYQYALHSVIYRLIEKSSPDYSDYLHNRGFSGQTGPKRFKLFTFSKINFGSVNATKSGFNRIREFGFIFSTPVEPSFEHLILGLFADQTFHFNFCGKRIDCTITRVETLPDPEFTGESRFLCLSPIAVSTKREKEGGGLEQHYLDYMNPKERERFTRNIRQNLIRKYETVWGTPYPDPDRDFEFRFDIDYIAKRQGKISKLIHFKKINSHTRTKIKAFEAPFIIKADPGLIRIGYEAGFGNDNAAGFGCAETINIDRKKR